jgi:1-acyl-sn-glycerol-3-phosphate acyltransferase
MIPHKRNAIIQKLFHRYVNYRVRKAFNVMHYNHIHLKPNHSVLLLCNHFSWWDGFWAGWLTDQYLHRDFYIMMQEDHLESRKWLGYMGGFSINRQSKEVINSLNYAADLLNEPRNLVTVFPQGALMSNHSQDIRIEKGIGHIIKKIKGDCQIIYYSAFIEYFESLKPSVYFHLLDCGTNHDLDFEQLKSVISTHHRQALKEQVNVHH